MNYQKTPLEIWILLTVLKIIHGKFKFIYQTYQVYAYSGLIDVSDICHNLLISKLFLIRSQGYTIAFSTTNFLWNDWPSMQIPVLRPMRNRFPFVGHGKF